MIHIKLDYKYMGLRIKELRKEKGLTQTQLANALGTYPSNVSRYEQGKTRMSMRELVKIANFFDTTISSFIKAEAVHYEL